jgi:hypothetical protein
MAESGEEVDPCVSPTATATFDPCAPRDTGEAGEVNPCETPSPTNTSEAPDATETTEPAPTSTPTLTPTLEYELDVPVSFFPDEETATTAAEETLAAAETVLPESTSTSDDGTDVTGLPNTGTTPSQTGSSVWVLAIVLLAVLVSCTLVVRVRTSEAPGIR